MSGQTEAMVDPAKNSLEKRMPENEHASERTPNGHERSMLDSKIDAKS